MFERPKIIKSNAIFAPVSQKVYAIMNRDAIDFERDGVFSLFRKLLIPTLLGSVAMSAMSTIDGIFVGHGVGAAGVAAVNIAVPVYQVMTGIGFMIGAGSSVVASIHLSRKNLKVARINVTQSLVFASLLAFLFVAAVMLFPVQSARILGSSESLMPMVLDYLKWVMPSFLFEIWVLIGLFVIRLDGSPRYAMWCNIVPAIVNVVLDWLLIIRLRMGVEGAAIASAAGIVVGGLMAAVYLLFFARTLRLIPLKISPMSMRLALRNIAYQCRIGSSSLLGELTLAVFIYVGNWQFMRYLGDDGVGAFGIACYYAPLFFMIGNAIAQSAQPIISYNYGIGRTTQVVQQSAAALCRRVRNIRVAALHLLPRAARRTVRRRAGECRAHRDSRLPAFRLRGRLLHSQCRADGILPEHRAGAQVDAVRAAPRIPAAHPVLLHPAPVLRH